ncbi:hypothetical protein TNCV_1284021 [Trichonephila clavipes]|uniref:Uncharacterized protein n=1 Tax=Trichonephila clavipes TaxID=2585209 RepID=A0A8X6VEQ3_TRICX|nr:hypothetical protein TNCV_1284021 [Trichonephila clavipes]
MCRSKGGDQRKTFLLSAKPPTLPPKKKPVWKCRWYWARTHDMTAMIRYLDHRATAALMTIADRAIRVREGSSEGAPTEVK